MLRLFELKLPLDHAPDDLPRTAAAAMRIPLADITSWEIRRTAVDARKKSEILLVYTLDLAVRHEDRLLKKKHGRRLTPAPDESYRPATPGSIPLPHPPIIVGSGPAGLFAGLILGRAGYRPVILERGRAVEDRCLDLERFWSQGFLDPESNAQFGEGGAGTFSDGKLTTRIHDPRCRKVLEELAAAGAPADILTSAKPHIGSDRLRIIVRSLRETIIGLGGEVRFSSRVSGLKLAAGQLQGVEINGTEVRECRTAVLAIGHSARDTFAMLHQAGLEMLAKPFAIGLRIEHPQAWVDQTQFGSFAGHPRLGAADYKLAVHADTGRYAYTFCMCPGGEVIAAATEPEGLVTNGMSLAARAGVNANSALLVDVGPADFPVPHPLAGFDFRREWEKRAFQSGGGNFTAPAQLLDDFFRIRPSQQFGSVLPTYRPGTRATDLDDCLPDYVSRTIRAAFPVFARQLPGFDRPDAVLTGVETRSSCPVRLIRNGDFQSSIGGIYPAGEGSGYAGGIVSAAVDGIRAAEAIITNFSPP